MAEKLISIILPAYNTKEEYLRESIQSILDQTYSNFEFIILNDGSTNNVEEIIFSYKDDRIKYVKNDINLGLIKTLNKGLEIAKGEYIARMDADDISLPQRLEKQIKFFEQNPDVSLLGAFYETFPNNEIVKHPEFPNYFDFIRCNALAHPTVMFRKNDFEKYGLKYDENYAHAEDYELWSRAIRYLKIANIQEVLLKYRIHEDSITGSKLEEQIACARRIQKNMLEFLTSDEQMHQTIFNFLYPPVPLVLKPHEQIFSIKNHRGWKIVTILGFKIKLKRKKKN